MPQIPELSRGGWLYIDCPRMEFLDVRNNLIRELEESSFATAVSLVYIRAGDNAISKVKVYIYLCPKIFHVPHPKILCRGVVSLPRYVLA